ncbi:PD-(D/E)XK nuclease family protein [Aurantimonas sp. DM33-3]|uniref:PD-(D/E)XK nuclease family protein n=1 Tax=Aurantimonas sp. DM33-3 TaxID=2766955 RepID=UPI001651E10F|nr:PD-(D/E)XK nuclease family protein [Aurantimonas sp. DM33-3]MBC6718666.1 PD-(D/E)XK nuclease family protein [Aurantimonas sp. DM33-3]
MLSDSAVLAFTRIATNPQLFPVWTETDARRLRCAATLILHRSSDAAAFLAPYVGQLTNGIEMVPILGTSGGPFGPAWRGHPFLSPAMDVGYKLREADLTRELAVLMGPSSGRRGSERAVSFLRVIADLARRPAIADALDDQTRPNVSAEHAVRTTDRKLKVAAISPAGVGFKKGSSPRIDLMFEWPVGTDGRQAVVVIEAKLGATVGEGQLKPYREEGKRRAKSGPLALVLLTAHADKATSRHRSWAAVRWFALMRRWENVLAAAGDDDSEFARVRAHVWRYILSSGGVFV